MVVVVAHVVVVVVVLVGGQVVLLATAKAGRWSFAQGASRQEANRQEAFPPEVRTSSPWPWEPPHHWWSSAGLCTGEIPSTSPTY